jgi:hypothetical protein
VGWQKAKKVLFQLVLCCFASTVGFCAFLDKYWVFFPLNYFLGVIVSALWCCIIISAIIKNFRACFENYVTTVWLQTCFAL